MRTIFHAPKPKKTARYISPESAKRERQGELRRFCKGRNLEESVRLRSSQRWQSLRDMALRRRPVCQVCGRVAVEVHHIIMSSESEELFFDVKNLACLCEACHVKVHSAYKRGIAPDMLFPPTDRFSDQDFFNH